MKKNFVFIFTIFVGLLFLFASEPDQKAVNLKELGLNDKAKDLQPGDSVKGVKLDIDFGKVPLYFISNKGQVNGRAKFYAKASRYTLWLTERGLVFDSTKRLKVKGEKAKEESGDLFLHSPVRERSGVNVHYERDVSRLLFIGANKNPEIVAIEEAKLKVNYFIGSDKSKWRCDVPTSKAVLYKNLYKNIDLKVYGIEKQIEYDWVVKPGGNPGDIRFAYKNVKSTCIDADGNLLIKTDFGELKHKKPVSYQVEKAGGAGALRQDGNKPKKEIVAVTFKKINKNTYGFASGHYDKSLELIIDPVVLAYSTYLGGESSDCGYGIAVDNSGNVYVTGQTGSTDFPTLNQYQDDQINSDVFVTKIDTSQSGASSLVYSTYLGGGSNDYGYGIAVDNSGNAYVTGYTYSTDFPILNQYQTAPSLYDYDAFVTKLDTTKIGSSSLIYSTYLGGSSGDKGGGISVDSSGYVYVTGETSSTDFPTLNQYQDDPGDFDPDIFISKIDTNQIGASSLIYSTYLGGGDRDYGHGIAVDNSGNAYVTGYTYSTDFPTLNQYQDDQINSDVFVSRIDTNKIGASSLIYSTYLGGGSYDYGYGIAVDSSGYVYVTGETSSTDFPTLNQYQDDQINSDVFVTKIDTSQSGASSLVYSTYLGGGSNDYGYGIAVDNSGNAYVTGYTYSWDFPALNQFQTYQLYRDVFVTRIDTNKIGASSLIYSTYLGGVGNDYGYGIAVDNSGNAYVTGYTYSTDFPTLNPYQSEHQGGYVDAFFTKISAFLPVLPTITTTGVSNITSITAASGGNVISDGGAEVISRGVCWSTSQDPTVENSHTTDGRGTGIFESSLTGLIPDTVYYARSYAANAAGTVYGNEETFRTLHASITVTSPNGGENWVVGSQKNITWTSDGVGDYIKIDYSTDNGGNWMEITASTLNDGTYPWDIPGGDSNQCLIRVSESDGSPSDISDNVFTIDPNPTITVAAPNGSETLGAGSIYDIAWTSEGNIGNVMIEYSTNGGSSWIWITTSTENDGTFNWTVPDTVSSQCLVKISETDGVPCDTSDALFSIILIPRITVTAPNGGEAWMVSTLQNITWTSVEEVGNVRIEYSTNNGDSWLYIIPSTPNDGSHPWTIPDRVSSQCLVRISETDGSPTDTSDTVFSIIPIPRITVTSPNGGKTWTAGTVQDITWTSIGVVGDVKIEYSTNNGDSWTTIIAATPNDGSHSWAIPNAASSRCLVRISETDGSPADTSDSVFTIRGVILSSPNGDEQWGLGTFQDITWQAEALRGNLEIELWQDGVLSGVIAAGIDPESGSYNWTVGEHSNGTAAPNTAGYTIKIKDMLSTLLDESDGSFEITKFSGIVSPNGGENWNAATQKEILWIVPPSLTSDLEINLWQDGVFVGTIAENIDPTPGSYNWTVGNYIGGGYVPVGSGYKIEIRKMGGALSDQSDESFNIDKPPVITVISPNGGELWQVGDSNDISWSAPGVAELLKITLWKDGLKVGDIAYNVDPAAGSIPWTVGGHSGGTVDPNTSGYTIKIKVKLIAAAADYSNAPFAITSAAPSITLLSPNGGEGWEIGTGRSITWAASVTTGLLTIGLLKDGVVQGIIAKNIDPASGSFAWTVGEYSNGTASPKTAGYTIGIKKQGSSVTDTSDAGFGITPPAPSITVISANGGESLQIGSHHIIRWAAPGVVGPLRIALFKDGTAVGLIADDVEPASGIFTWTVSNYAGGAAMAGTGYKIKIKEKGIDNSDISDSAFELFD